MKTITIFALIFGKKVYIGKTASCRLSAIYWRHCRSEVVATRRFTKKGGKPRLHLLHREQMKTYQAYRFVVVYVHMFQQAGYEVLNCARTIMQANDLHPETKALADELTQEDIEQMLLRTLVEKPTDADYRILAEEVNTKEAASQKLTVRLSSWEKARFIRFAGEMQMTQRQAVQYLLSKFYMEDTVFPPWEDDLYVRTLLKAYRDENQKLRSENESLKEQLGAGRKNALERKKEQMQCLKTGITTFFGMMQPSRKVPLTVERGSYKDNQHTDKYHYPAKAGVYVLRPTNILYGKGRYPAIFICGVGDNEESLKFRFYPKPYFSGINPNNERFWLRGSVWLIGCEVANDLAMDITFALPLDVTFRYNGPEEYGSASKRDIANIMQEIESYNE